MQSSASALLHPAAPHQLPMFITAPGETDGLMVATGLFLILAVVGIGVLYFQLHALPEQMAHRGQKVQFELVAVLALLALFSHNHTFWVAGLLLALVPLPDFTTPLRTIATSLEKIAAAQSSNAMQISAQPPCNPAPSESAPIESTQAAAPQCPPASERPSPPDSDQTGV